MLYDMADFALIIVPLVFSAFLIVPLIFNSRRKAEILEITLGCLFLVLGGLFGFIARGENGLHLNIIQGGSVIFGLLLILFGFYNGYTQNQIETRNYKARINRLLFQRLLTTTAQGKSSFNELLRFLLYHTLRFIGYQSGCIYIFNDRENKFILGASQGITAELAGKLRELAVGEKRIELLSTGKIQYEENILWWVNGLDEESDNSFDEPAVIIPIKKDENLLGVLILFGGSKRFGETKPPVYLHDIAVDISSALEQYRHRKMITDSVSSVKINRKDLIIEGMKLLAGIGEADYDKRLLMAIVGLDKRYHSAFILTLESENGPSSLIGISDPSKETIIKYALPSDITASLFSKEGLFEYGGIPKELKKVIGGAKSIIINRFLDNKRLLIVADYKSDRKGLNNDDADYIKSFINIIEEYVGHSKGADSSSKNRVSAPMDLMQDFSKLLDGISSNSRVILDKMQGGYSFSNDRSLLTLRRWLRSVGRAAEDGKKILRRISKNSDSEK